MTKWRIVSFYTIFVSRELNPLPVNPTKDEIKNIEALKRMPVIDSKRLRPLKPFCKIPKYESRNLPESG